MIRPQEILRILRQRDVFAFDVGWHVRLEYYGQTFDCRWSEYQQAVEKLRKTQ